MEKINVRKCALKYPGAKNRIAGWICGNIPAHDVYLEPFFGSGAVFFNKQPAKIETINDLDDNVVNYFKVIREKSDELISALRMTPYSREEYNRSFDDMENDSDVEMARKFAIKCWMGFGCSNLYRNGFRSSQQSKSPNTTKEWNEFPDRLLFVAERLKEAQIEKNEVGSLPQVLLMENVTEVHGERNAKHFQDWISFLESKGYSNYWQDINASDYGVAQNRDRCIMVSILGQYNYKFPRRIDLEKTMEDYLEPDVESRYFVKTEKARKLIERLIDAGQIEPGIIQVEDEEGGAENE